MSYFICPVCGKELFLNYNTAKCENNHNYDISKSGYINLLQSQQSKNKRHGDDKFMVKARTDFLNSGYYEKLLFMIIEIIKKHINSDDINILDVGCGECYYTSAIYSSLIHRYNVDMLAIDISKNSLIAGSKRSKNIKMAVSSVSKLPIADKSIDILINIFAPESEEEFFRVIKRNGIFIKVIPLENHLLELKKLVYEKPYKNEIQINILPGFEIVEKNEIKYKINPHGDDIKNLFMMTPYFYKTSSADQEKLKNVNELLCSAEFGITVYKKI